MIYDVCVIGGGASGLAAAVSAGREGASVLVLERMDKTGKKIQATGNGKCNLTNAAIVRWHIPAGAYRCRQRNFPVQVLNAFDCGDTLSFFESMGLYTRNRENYIYPLSEQASAVGDALKWGLAENKTDVMTGEEVCSVQIIKDVRQGRFLIKTDKAVYRSRKLILATGGKSAEKLGSNGSGYELCRQLGHRILPVVPALCALCCREKYFKELAGIRLQGRIQLLIDGKVAAEDRGELQLTAYGISGIPVFQVSRYGAYGLLDRRDVRAVLDLMPDLDQEILMARLLYQTKAHPEWTMGMILSGMMNRKLALCLLKLCGSDSSFTCRQAGKRLLSALVSRIKHMEVHITGTNGFEQSQVTAGGVDTREIDAYNMSSKIVRGLYITGELLDVDGICGGYNLQWAWATGVLAGMDAGRSYNDKG